jgi:DUF1365 family protein
MSNMHSCIYEGQVRHRRLKPRSHRFQYRVFMLYLDLDELPQVFEPYWLWSVETPSLAQFRRVDHLGDQAVPLKQAVLDEVERQTGHRPAGPVRLLTNLRYFGYVFNPICLYYCYAADGTTLEAIAAEVSNTPWNERHVYVLDARVQQGHRRKFSFEQDKEFHVSPFMEMAMRYKWRFLLPEHKLAVHIENRQANDKLFDATLVMERRPINHATLAVMLLKYPLMTLKVTSGIYFEALRLFLKGINFVSHPDKHKTVESS